MVLGQGRGSKFRNGRVLIAHLGMKSGSSRKVADLGKQNLLCRRDDAGEMTPVLVQCSQADSVYDLPDNVYMNEKNMKLWEGRLDSSTYLNSFCIATHTLLFFQIFQIFGYS